MVRESILHQLVIDCPAMMAIAEVRNHPVWQSYFASELRRRG